jgi:pSer/pThr/pTyr-binding forkhead associated (FHA) protein
VAYLVVTLDGVEIQRRKLDETVVVGRSLEADIAVEDLAISRRHCQFEPEGDRWAVVDLKSRNGTRVNSHSVERQVLKEGDVVSIGHTRIAYHAGKFVGPRPADPTEALMSETMPLIPPRREKPSKPLPVPKIGRVDTQPPVKIDESLISLPFTRPPARPIVKPQE